MCSPDAPTDRSIARSFAGWPPGPRNLSHLMRLQTTTHGHAPFLTYYNDLSGERTELSYATFDNWVAKTANLLSEELELGRGSRVALATGAHWTAVVMAFACWRLGACVAPVPARKPALVSEALRRIRPDAIVAWEDIAGALDDTVLDGTVLAVGGGFGGRLTADIPGVLPYAQEVLAFGDDFDDPDVCLDDHALLVPGCGASTGATALVLDQGNLLAGALALKAWGGLSIHARLLSAGQAPPVEGLVFGQLGPFVAGASSVLVRDLDVRTFARKVREERVGWALPPTALLDNLASGIREDLGPLCGFLRPVGVPRSLRSRVETATGLRVHVGQGIAAATCASTLETPDLDEATRAWIDSSAGAYVGSPTVWAEVAERGGELCVRGPLVMAGHDGRPELDALAFAGGWLHTGEAGRVQEGPDGRLHVWRT